MDDFITSLFNRRNDGIQPGLERSKRLLEVLGNPQDSYASIHVAGTNGKGSVATLCESVLRSLGFRSALYTSPHLVKFNERIKVCGLEISDNDVSRLASLVMPEVGQLETDEKLGRYSFYEITTAIAFLYFKEQGVQAAVIETGMGGRWDTTNVIDAMVSVITTIDYDHTEYLGDTIEDIALEKAGIIKAAGTVVVGALSAEADKVVRAYAKGVKARMIVAPELVSAQRMSPAGEDGQKVSFETPSANYGRIILPLHGDHQVQNAGVAIATLEVFMEKLNVPLPVEVVKRAFEGCRFQGRYERLSATPSVWLDCAHNKAAAESLANLHKNLNADKDTGLIIGLCADKDTDTIIATLGAFAQVVWCVPVRSVRSARPDMLMTSARAICPDSRMSDLEQAVLEGLEWARKVDGVLLIAGSVFLAGEVLSHPEWFANCIK